MGRKGEGRTIVFLVSTILVLLSVSLAFAGRDPLVGVWTFPREGLKDRKTGALILEKSTFGLVDDWKDTKHQAPVSGTWSIVDGVLILRVKHTEAGEIQEDSEMHWKVILTGDSMRVTPDDGSPAVVLKRLPARFDRTVMLPDSTRYKVKSEFKYEPQGTADLLSPRLHKKIIEGGYFGQTQIKGKKYYRYKFSNILKGDHRTVDLYLEVPSNAKKQSQHLVGFLRETGQDKGPTTEPAFIFYHYHPSYDREEVVSYIEKRGLSQKDSFDYARYVACWVWDYEQTFICYPPFEWTHIDSWTCAIDVKRSK